MKYIADLHVHSYLSRATARDLDLEHLWLWAQRKGIGVVGTGDFTHPQWFSEIRDKLEPAESGLYQLKSALARDVSKDVPASCRGPVRFLLSVEISSIYKKNGKVRKIHTLVFAPDLSVAEKINASLTRVGNLRADGRPILGLDAKDLAATVLDISEDALVVPAHIWTPWFSLLGSKSGFDSVEECFEDLSRYIYAAETGLSSDPAMNRMVSDLDALTLISNSDAHSPANLGREANLFDTELSYQGIADALKSGDPALFMGTIEYFPEEGKYHFDGHRKCAVRFSPEESREQGCRCPSCGKPLTIGVMHRVAELADRKDAGVPAKSRPFTRLVPLTDVLAEVFRVGPKTKRVQETYHHLLKTLGPEFHILRESSREEIASAASPLVAEAILRARQERVHIAPGYDGEFGKIHLFADEELAEYSNQPRLFQGLPGRETPSGEIGLSKERLSSGRLSSVADGLESAATTKPLACAFPEGPQARAVSPTSALNSLQQEAVEHVGGPLLIVAGPGTGKTRTITHRIAHLVSRKVARPEQVLAITFTNKAADEMRGRLGALIPDGALLERMTVKTFHSFCLGVLLCEGDAAGNKGPFTILNDAERTRLIRTICPRSNWAGFAEALSRAKQQLLSPEDDCSAATLSTAVDAFPQAYAAYEQTLQENGLLDYEDLIFRVARLFEAREDIRRRYQDRFRFVSVDEYQDINYSQYRLIRLMAPSDHDLCAIGDPDQAIYGFRGSDVRFFHQFREDYPSAKVLRLCQNYRSTETILQASSQVLGGADPENTLWSGIHGERWLAVTSLPTDRDEAEFVVRSIEKEVGGTSHLSIYAGKIDESPDGKERSFSDFAVLYRLNEQGRCIEEAFVRSGIPFQRLGKEPFSQQRGVAELLGCLDVLDGQERAGAPGGALAFRRRHKLKGHLEGMRPLLRDADVRQRLERLVEGLDFFLNLREEADFQDNLRHLLSVSERFGKRIADFLAYMALEGDSDRYDARAEKVTLMTMHAAKGLEFPVVFIVGCEEGLIPYDHGNGTKTDLHEETRLFYVGLTRAREKAFLTWAKKRLLLGSCSLRHPSRYLESIGRELKREEKRSCRLSRPAEREMQLGLFGKDSPKRRN